MNIGFFYVYKEDTLTIVSGWMTCFCLMRLWTLFLEARARLKRLGEVEPAFPFPPQPGWCCDEVGVDWITKRIMSADGIKFNQRYWYEWKITKILASLNSFTGGQRVSKPSESSTWDFDFGVMGRSFREKNGRKLDANLYSLQVQNRFFVNFLPLWLAGLEKVWKIPPGETFFWGHNLSDLFIAHFSVSAAVDRWNHNFLLQRRKLSQ